MAERHLPSVALGAPLARLLDPLHRLADDLVGRAARAGLLYRGGFGDRARLEEHVAAVRTYSRSKPLGDVAVTWHTELAPSGKYFVRTGRAPSPSPVALPRESLTAAFELWLPRREHRGAMCVLLATTAEEGFLRRRIFSRRLLAEGVGVLLLENPFYGSRRPSGQMGPAIRTVEEQFAMNLATVDEARALLAWLRQSYSPVGVSGYSQGGFMSAFAAALVDFEVVAVPRGAGTSAVPVFTRSAMSEGIAWPTLAAEAGSERSARELFADYLRVVDVSLHPPPVAPALSTIVAVRHDRFVPPEDMEALHAHWRGSRLVWSEAGHVSSAIFDRKTHAQAILEAFRRAPESR
jgi:hypothetical protein